MYLTTVLVLLLTCRLLLTLLNPENGIITITIKVLSVQNFGIDIGTFIFICKQKVCKKNTKLISFSILQKKNDIYITFLKGKSFLGILLICFLMCFTILELKIRNIKMLEKLGKKFELYAVVLIQHKNIKWNYMLWF